MAVAPSTISLDFGRDAALNDFTIQTLAERYLTNGETSPQQGWGRAAAAFADDEAHAQRLYDYAAKGWFAFATPLLSNGGTSRGLPISCFLTAVEDSRESISDHYDELIWLSSEGGGIGSYWGELRSNGETTSRGSQSTGVMPFMAVDDRLILAVSQGGTRRGSEAVYLDIHHPEIREFIRSRVPTGGDQNRKIINLHNAVNVTDEFMFAVRDDTSFNLRSPKNGDVIEVVNARSLWQLLLETRMQTGEPYIHFIDASNRAMPLAQQRLGLKVKQSNLCVTGETEILTRSGHLPIAALEGSDVEVWNGADWSTVKIVKTADNAELVRVWFEDGDYIDCTPEHKFYDADGEEVRAGALTPGLVLQQGDGALPVIRNEEATDPKSRAAAYSEGWATFAGFEDSHRLAVHAPESAGDAVIKRLLTHSVDPTADDSGVTIRYEPTTIKAGDVPLHYGFERRLMWLAGALDAVGDWVELEDGRWLIMGSTDAKMIRDMRLLAKECGQGCRIRLTDTMNGFMLDGESAERLLATAYLLRQPPALTPGVVESRQPLEQVIADLHPLAWTAPTYCANEPKRHRLTFQGYITGNCSEITLASGRDKFGKMRTAVCCLSSVNAETFDEWCDDAQFIEDMFRMLDNTLQVFIDTAPPGMANAVYSAMRERAVGLGLLGFRAYLQRHNVAMDSEEARRINLAMFTYLRAQADRASQLLGAERGEAPDMEGTGERFSHKLAVAPNASSAIIVPTPNGSGTSASIEPDRANAYLHKTLSGSFPVKNPYLKLHLAKIGQDTEEVWQSIVAHEGSVQHLDFLDAHTKRVFQTAIEMPQISLVRLAADRAHLLCQSQSLNVFFPHDATAEEINETHYRAWEWGCKSMYYLRSTTPKRAENTNTKIERKTMQADYVEAPSAGISMSPGEDSACVACEG